MVCVIVITPLDNNVEAMTSGLLTLSFKKRPWSKINEPLLIHMFKSHNFCKPTNYPRGYIFKTLFLQLEKLFKSTSQKTFFL
jgi:hypothetical protein